MNEAQLRSIVTPHNFVLPHNMPTALNSCTFMAQWDCVFNTSFQAMNSVVVA